MDSDRVSPFVLAEQFEDQGQYELAIEQYKQVIKSGIGDQALAYAKVGQNLNRLGQFEEAFAECQQALNLNPNLSLAYGVLGYICLKQTDYDQAEKHLLRAVGLDSSDTNAHINLAYVYQQQNRLDLSAAVLSKILDSDPNNFAVVNSLVRLYKKMSRDFDAIKLAEKYVIDRPDDLSMRLELASLYILESNFKPAIRQLNEAYRIKPTNWRIFFLYSFTFLGYIMTSRLILGGLLVGVSLIALFSPVGLGISFGIVLSIFFLLLMLLSLWGNRSLGRILPIVWFSLSWCVIYWFFFWIGLWF